MSGSEVRRFFDTVATGGPPPSIDVDAAVRAGRRRRRRRTATVVLAGAATLAVVGVVVVAALPSRTTQPPASHPSPTPTGSRPSLSESPSLAGQGLLVTSTDQLLGSWWAQELDGQDVEDVRDGSGDPLVLSFHDLRGRTSWSANDGCNAHFGHVSVSTDGGFVSKGHGSTLVACPTLEAYDANWKAVVDADEARLLLPGTETPQRLILQRGDRVLGVYARVSDAQPGLGYGTVLTSGPGDGEGMAAEVRGRLTMGKDDCLGLDGETAVFPQGTTWSGALGLLILPDGSTAHLGEALSGGGGYVPPKVARTWVEDPDLRGICTWSSEVPVFNRGSALAVEH